MPAERVRQVEVELGSRRYPIVIGAGLLADAGRLVRHVRGRHVLVVSDANVAPLYAAPVLSSLRQAGRRVACLELPPGEAHKSLQGCERVFGALAALGASRDATVVALGGGVIGDLAGFAAACWMRGVDFLQLPTTLLAMVDSSVGGKTAVNLPQGKNLVGAFHQPVAVLADIGTLATLPDRELRAGLAEVLKYGAIGDRPFFDWVQAHAPDLLARDPDALATAIESCCRHKAGIVARDETERGERALLNFGHSFGHAIEACAGYGAVLHGEAVAVGMVAAARLSARLGRADPADAERLEQALQALALPTRSAAGLDPDALLQAMRLDKKTVSGTLRLVLWRGIGAAEVVAGVDEADIRAVLAG
ncbi:MAG TPA: 3-dehydroquinate synthase [Xanthomonadaceae bacterium]|nr:3-dehydroquinate synthase [Xanthomonadaceae bacterium]